MPLNEALLAELKLDSANTRKMLERVPTDKLSWKPHEKSMSVGRLATHVAELYSWLYLTVTQDELDLGKSYKRGNVGESTEAILDIFDKNIKEGKDILQDASDEVLNGNWTLRDGASVFFVMPRKVVIRNMIYNHIIHHRGQLSVCLRLLNVQVPGMYGPSADER
jgi:uncharacterized damage-inducible protein DinB